MTYSRQFLHAFNHAMLYEVGNFFDPGDPEVQQGLIETRQQRRKVGYVNIPADRGGETKFGVAQRPNPDVNVRSLTLLNAMEVYHRKYWLEGRCDRVHPALAIIHFDGCVNHGVRRACRFFQRAAGVDEDGILGPRSLAAADKAGAVDMIRAISNIRTNFYHEIVRKDPSQSIFMNGWMRRISEVTEYSLSLVDA